MQRILITSLSVHWMVVFAIAAAQAGGQHAQQPVLSGLVATGNALVSILFLWTAVSAWSRRHGEAEGVARLAFTGSVVVLSLAALFEVLIGGSPALGLTATQLAALGVTYLVVRSEKASAVMETGTSDLSGAFARRMALAAAHGTMLARLSKRGAATETDA